MRNEAPGTSNNLIKGAISTARKRTSKVQPDMQQQSHQDLVYQVQQQPVVQHQQEVYRQDKFLKYRRRVDRLKKQPEESPTKPMADVAFQIQHQPTELLVDSERKNSEDSQIPAIKQEQQPQAGQKRSRLQWLYSLIFCCNTEEMPVEKYEQAAGTPIKPQQQKQADPVILQTAEQNEQKPAEPLDNALQALHQPKKTVSHQPEHQKYLLRPLSPESANKKCLVLDLDETLVHSSFKPVNNSDFIIPVEIENQLHNVYVLKRPHVDEFLLRMGEHYEVVIFTASLSKYADPVIDQLDIHRVVKHRLFRESCFNHRGSYVKDLSQLGRDIRSIIILDNSPASYLFHPNNAVPITSWFNDPNDTELLELIPLLVDMTYVDNVVQVLDQNDDEDDE